MVMNVQTNSKTHALQNTDVGSTLQSLTEVTHLIVRGVYVASTKYRAEADEDTLPYIRVGDMQDGTISQRNLVYVTKSDIKPPAKLNTLVHPKDLLISLTGTIGKISVIPPEISEALVNSGIGIIKPKLTLVEPTYLSLVLQSSFIRKQLERLTRGPIIQKVPISDLRQLKIPVPTLQDQRKLASYRGKQRA
jgi:type I restriction enzyme S subunit